MTENESPFRAYYTPLEEAIAEIERRRTKTSLLHEVEEYLQQDIPDHFRRETPILYMSRYVATPNYEALRFLELTKGHPYPAVISQDVKGKFVSHNELKRSLGKLPVTKGMSRRFDEITEYFTIVDFSKSQGRQFCEIVSSSGIPLVEFHNNLFSLIPPYDAVEIFDESQWIDRNYREDLKAHYHKVIALFLAHGILFESYTYGELDFFESVLCPAFEAAEKTFGHRPLIVDLIDDELEMTKNWNGYPSILYQFIKSQLT